MNKKHWFQVTKYGWGWKPIHPAGWAVFIFYALLNVTLFVAIDETSHSASDTLFEFALYFLATTALLYSICIMKSARRSKLSASPQQEDSL